MMRSGPIQRGASASVGVTAALVLSGCAAFGQSEADDAVSMTGSATIEPISVIASRDAGLDTSVEAVGSNAGFEKFCAGEFDIVNASSPISGPEGVADYQQQCEDHDVEYVELVIGLDAISIVRNDAADFVDDLTSEELTAIWEPESGVETWADVRDEWPDESIELFGRDEASGTFAEFTEAALGEVGQIRSDYEPTNDLGQLANWVAEDSNGLAFMGIGNYLSATEEDRNRITTVTIDGIASDAVSAADDSYPLVRELYMYVSMDALDEHPHVEDYATYMLENGRSIVPRAFFYPLNESAYEEELERLEQRTAGTRFGS